MSYSNKTYSRQAKSMNTRSTPQMQPTPGKTEHVNNAGGYGFKITKWEQLNRFLILGSESGTYYVGEKKLTRDNAKNVESCIMEDGRRVVDIVVAISDSGRAPKNDAALFVLAMCAGLGNESVRKYALENLPKVARIGTHLFHFAEYVQEFRGWGHGLRKAIANWYTEKDTNKLALQLVKYQSRDGWSHQDLIRLSHPKTSDADKNLALRWAVKGSDSLAEVYTSRWKVDVPQFDPLSTIYAFERVKSVMDEKDIIRLVQYYKLPLEAVPTEKQTRGVLASAIPHLGITALIRNLGRYSKEGILTATSDETKMIVKKLTDIEELRKGRVHPLNVLFALTTYASGHGFRGGNTWDVISKLVDALNEAFYLSFGLVTPTGKRIRLALDISGSMFFETSKIAGTNLFAGEAAAAMAMVTARTEKDYDIVGFSNTGNRPSAWHGYNSGLMPLDISPTRRLDDICNYTRNLPFGGTDCALPMVDALEKKLEFDLFCTITDSESWSGNIKPFQALKQYRDAMGIPAKLVVIGMTATDITIADPDDAGSLDIVGFDTATPQIISDFAIGNM